MKYQQLKQNLKKKSFSELTFRIYRGQHHNGSLSVYKSKCILDKYFHIFLFMVNTNFWLFTNQGGTYIAKGNIQGYNFVLMVVSVSLLCSILQFQPFLKAMHKHLIRENPYKELLLVHITKKTVIKRGDAKITQQINET